MDDDPCECLFNHETAMRRLLSLLRDSQGYCTDSECVQDLPGPQGAGFGANNLMMIVILWALLAVAMFLLRPNSMRSRPDSLGKPGPRPGGDAPEPPAPSVH
ncbi:hypothetical protein WUBG_00801 [Wuchereria bancrofti]|uniref:Small integral membrane protein 14 n=1 Tax=Wuchereria bancrofti TaxID=6293 RepID=J9FLM0_WUCBA|nr:hypothetical protein WUBG_00801 [Wuchereria bancrofti]VDM20282.1 unnamed protein product [Wuchereria bancrofti]